MCVIPGGNVTSFFAFCYSGEYFLGGGLEGINQYQKKDDKF